jgi:hypothetical protein
MTLKAKRKRCANPCGQNSQPKTTKPEAREAFSCGTSVATGGTRYRYLTSAKVDNIVVCNDDLAFILREDLAYVRSGTYKAVTLGLCYRS